MDPDDPSRLAEAPMIPAAQAVRTPDHSHRIPASAERYTCET